MADGSAKSGCGGACYIIPDKRNILVCNVPDYGTTEVADHAMALALTLRRGILLHHELQRRDPPAPWRSFHHPMIRRLGVQNFGIIRLGRIGTAVALRDGRQVFYERQLVELIMSSLLSVGRSEEWLTSDVRLLKLIARIMPNSLWLECRNAAADPNHAACVHQIEMSLLLPFRNVTAVGVGRRAGAEPRRSAALDRRPMHGCSKVRTDGFDGMAALITDDRIIGKSTHDLIAGFLAEPGSTPEPATGRPAPPERKRTAGSPVNRIGEREHAPEFARHRFWRISMPNSNTGRFDFRKRVAYDEDV